MASVLRLVGKDAAVKIGGSAFAKCRRWEIRPRVEFAKARAAGDGTMVNVPLWGDFEVTASFITDAAEPYPTTHFSSMSSFTAVTFILQLHSSDTSTTGFIAGSGFISETPVTTPHDDVVEFGLTIIPDGNALTYDGTPAT